MRRCREMDGFALARAIKSDPKLASTRLIMLNTLDREESAEEFREAGVEAVLTKPVRQSQLLITLDQRDRQRRRAARDAVGPRRAARERRARRAEARAPRRCASSSPRTIS